jgi:hypothetical protein
MKSKNWQRALCGASLAAAAAAPAAAAVISMEGVAPGSLYFPGESFSEAGHSLTIQTSAGVVDTSAAFGVGLLDLAAPKGNATQYFIGLNDGSLRLRASDNSVFKVSSFDFAFIAPQTGLFAPGEVPGGFGAAYETGAGVTGILAWPFQGADTSGEFNFQTAGLADVGLLADGVRQVEFFACTFVRTGQCVNPNNNFGQFALDNIVIGGAATVPTPGSLALALLALGLAAGVRTRRAA